MVDLSAPADRALERWEEIREITRGHDLQRQRAEVGQAQLTPKRIDDPAELGFAARNDSGA